MASRRVFLLWTAFALKRDSMVFRERARSFSLKGTWLHSFLYEMFHSFYYSETITKNLPYYNISRSSQERSSESLVVVPLILSFIRLFPHHVSRGGNLKLDTFDMPRECQLFLCRTHHEPKRCAYPFPVFSLESHNSSWLILPPCLHGITTVINGRLEVCLLQNFQDFHFEKLSR